MATLSNDVNAFVERRSEGGDVNVLIYGRKSRKSENKRKKKRLQIQKSIDRFDSPLSIQYQIEQCEKFAKTQGWKIKGIYQDIKSGTTHKRNDLINLREQIDKDPSIIMILVHRFDRLARGPLFEKIFYELWKRPNPVLIFPVNTPQIDFSSMQKFVQRITSGAAELEVNSYVERVFEVTLKRAESARLCGGRPPYGFNVTDEGVYYIDEEKRAEIEFCFTAVRDGMGYGQIIAHVHKEFGTKLSKGALVSRLRQEKYAGIFVFNKKGGKRRADRVLDKEYSEIRIDDGVPAFISSELFFEVQNILDGRQGQGGRGKNRDRHPLNDKIFCKTCGRQMRGSRATKCGRNKTPYDSYECPQHRAKFDSCPGKAIGGSAIEDFCLDALDVAINTHRFKQALLDGIAGKQTAEGKKISKLEKDNHLLENGINQAVTELLASPSLRAELTRRIEVNRGLIAANDVKIAELKTGQDKLSKLTVDNLILPPCRTFSYETRLALIDNFIQRIIVDNENIEIYFN